PCASSPSAGSFYTGPLAPRHFHSFPTRRSSDLAFMHSIQGYILYLLFFPYLTSLITLVFYLLLSQVSMLVFFLTFGYAHHFLHLDDTNEQVVLLFFHNLQLLILIEKQHVENTYKVLVYHFL